jgi:hypothetical protein
VTPLPPRLFDDDPPHGLGLGPEEVAPAVPVRLFALTNQPEVGLVDQRGGLQGLSRFFVSQALVRWVDERIGLNRAFA